MLAGLCLDIKRGREFAEQQRWCALTQSPEDMEQTLRRLSVASVGDVFELCAQVSQLVSIEAARRPRVIVVDGLGSLLYDLQGGSSHHHRSAFLLRCCSMSRKIHGGRASAAPSCPCRAEQSVYGTCATLCTGLLRFRLWLADAAAMLAVGRVLKAAARQSCAAVLVTNVTLAASTNRHRPELDKPERQALGRAWESQPHCRLLLQRQHAIGGAATSRRVSRLAGTLGVVLSAEEQSAHVLIEARGLVPCD